MNIPNLNKLQSMLSKWSVETPDKGFYTCRQLSKEWKVSERTASIRIRKCTDAGIMVCKNFKVKTGMVIRPVPHYKVYDKI